MRDELENGGPESGRPPAVPPWTPPGPRTPLPDSIFTGQAGDSGYGSRPFQPPPAAPQHAAAPPHRRRRGRGRRFLLVLGLLAALAGLVLSAGAAAVQFLPRSFSQAERQQIMSWEVAKRWRSWPPGRIFPAAIGYKLPGSAFGGGAPLALRAQRVGIAAQASCRDGTARPAGRVLAQRGCLAILRATYQDATQTLAVTVGVAVLPASSAAQAQAALHHDGDPPPWLRAVSFRRTTTAHFAGPGHKVGWSSAMGPYLVLTTVGYADGRPWLSQGHDTYTETEMDSLASGVGQSVASRLGAPAPVPHCPGSPGC
jgi:hypothetical protein